MFRPLSTNSPFDHIGFFDDRLAMPDIFGANHAEAIRNGIRVVKMDPVPILATMAVETRCLGLAATCSVLHRLLRQFAAF